MQLGFAKAHHQIPLEEKWVWPWARGAPRNWRYPFNISAMAEATWVFSRPTIKPHPEEK